MGHLGADSYLPGDVLGFSRRGCVGYTINLATWGIPGWGLSHVALVGRHPRTGVRVLWESLLTIDRRCLVQGTYTTGVQVQPIKERIRRYPGRVWHYPLVEPLHAAQLEELDDFCLEYLGVDYDQIGAFRSRGLSLVERFIFRPQDLTSVFCEEFLLAVHHRLGLVNGNLNASRMNPNKGTRYEVKQGVLSAPLRIK